MLEGRVELEGRFRQLDRLLAQWRPLWSLESFTHRECPWPERAGLQGWLAQLDEPAIERLENDPRALTQALQPFISDAETLLGLTAIPETVSTPVAVDPALGFKVPGRKWEQILAFAAQVPEPLCAPWAPLAGQQSDAVRTDAAHQSAHHSPAIVEWCAGKGHLGRVLADRHRCAVASLEYDPQLCRMGAQLAERHRLPQRFLCEDALSERGGALLQNAGHAVALHACGELHLQLMREGARQQLAGLSLSPCCFHLIADEHYQPLSLAGQESPLRLSRHELRLPLQETVTAGRRVRQLRQREVSWRLGFDLLQRDLRGEDQYLRVPTVQKSLLMESFPAFCRWAAERKGLDLPESVDYAGYESGGRDRYQQVQRWELVRHLFRRPLELWLVLDRALFLLDNGYQVSVREFCDYHLTPRNLLIQAVRG